MLSGILLCVIAFALIFEFINGFHDAANSIATIVSTRVLTPFQAVLWAAFFNFVAFFIAKYIIGGFGIANTVSKTVLEDFITLPIILSGVIAAIIWNLFTWWKGIPSSSSHTLIGGFAGAAIMGAGWSAVQGSIILKIALFIFAAPLIGMVISFLFTLLVLNICKNKNPHKCEVWFKRLQLVSSALFSVGHGLNDSQKVMGIIAAALIAAHSDGLGMGINSINDLPNWVAYSLTKQETTGAYSRENTFYPDPQVKGDPVITKDYSNSGYDRGHMAPAADMKWSEKAMRESFYMTNICPQNQSLNRGDWNDLEELARDWAYKYNEVFIACGPIVTDPHHTIGQTRKIVVPSAFYKVFLRKKGSTWSCIGFVFPNQSGSRPLMTYVMSINEIEQMTGIDFFYHLPDEIEDSIENNDSFADWTI